MTSSYAIYLTRRGLNKIPSLDDFVEIREGEKGEKEVFIEPRLALVIDGLSKRLGQSFFQSFKMSGLQGLGASAKIEKGLKTAMTQDVIDEKMPLLNLAGEFLGLNTKQYISKHPEALMQLANLAAPYLSKMRFGKNNSPGSNVPQM